ncbi:DUF2752 domain-containing protein [Rhodococcus kronopolitis]|uniref:DUF2752 domain-containing protein n=1 Tax=Rhodococcus kronopolitis TaxID=1460226 RepID=A0ABV9FVB1_9NOCA
MTVSPPGIRARAIRAPAVVAVGSVAAAALLYLRDPHRPGAYGVCPFHALTGLWCPGCGGLRAMADLTHGDVPASLSSNLFVLPLVLVATVAWWGWARRRWRGAGRVAAAGRTMALGRTGTVGVLVALAVFTVARNTPWGAWLAPT